MCEFVLPEGEKPKVFSCIFTILQSIVGYFCSFVSSDFAVRHPVDSRLLNPLLVCPVAGDPVPDVGSSSLLYYQTPLVEVPDHLVYLLCHHSLHFISRHPQAAGVHYTEVTVQLYLEGLILI